MHWVCRVCWNANVSAVASEGQPCTRCHAVRRDENVDIPIGPSRAEAIRVAVAAERASILAQLADFHAALWRASDSNGLTLIGADEETRLTDDQCLYAAKGVRHAMHLLRKETP